MRDKAVGMANMLIMIQHLAYILTPYLTEQITYLEDNEDYFGLNS